MKTNLYDEAVGRVLNRIETASDVISKNFKGVKPFDKKELSNDELFGAYDQLGTLDMEYLIQKHGEEKVGQFIADMETHKARKK